MRKMSQGPILGEGWLPRSKIEFDQILQGKIFKSTDSKSLFSQIQFEEIKNVVLYPEPAEALGCQDESVTSTNLDRCLREPFSVQYC